MNESADAAEVATRTQLENYYRWVEPDSTVTVCLRLDTVDRLQREVLRGVDSLLCTGDEVGGILLGRIEFDQGRTLTFVDDFESIPSEHTNGRAYVLKGAEKDEFEAALARHSERQTNSVVGYFRSHNRDGLFLSADDVWLIEHHFRAPDNLFLLIKTLSNRACTAGFFFWKEGQLQADFTDSEAPLIPISLSPMGRSLALQQAEIEIPPAMPEPIPMAPQEVRLTLPAELEQSHGFRRGLIYATAIAGIAAAITVAALSRHPAEPAPNPVSSAPQPVEVAATQSQPAITNPIRPPAPVREQTRAAIPSSTGTSAPQFQNKPSIPPGEAPKLAAPAPTQEATAVRPPVEAATVAPSATKPTTSVLEPPAVAAPPRPVETASAPPVPIAPPKTETPAAPTNPAPRPEATAAVATPTPSSPSIPQTTHTLAGPQVTHQVAPAVPRGVGPMISGDVEVGVEVTIDARGKVTGARIASTKGTAAELLTIEALKAAQLFRFKPAQEDGRNVPSSTILTFRFARTAK